MKNEDLINMAVGVAEDLSGNPQASIHMINSNIDHSRVAEYFSGKVSRKRARFLRRMVSDGWVVFGIQTESDKDNHSFVKAYLAKYKP